MEKNDLVYSASLNDLSIPEVSSGSKMKEPAEENSNLLSKNESGNHENELATDLTEQEHTESVGNTDDIIPIDYSGLSLEQLTVTMNDLLLSGHIQDISKSIEIIRVCFYKRFKTEQEEIKQKFIAEGGEIKDFIPVPNPAEVEFKILYKKYKENKALNNKDIERQKETNLQARNDVIEEIKKLINGQELKNKTFHEFRNLQQRWKEIGPAPSQKTKELYENYHFVIEKFYSVVNINKELRDLDLKKNLEAKVKLCEKAESLLLEPSIKKAFKELQQLHINWRETGPVFPEKKDEIWLRFKNISSLLNKKHNEYFESLKKDQESNLQLKTSLCEKLEELTRQEMTNYKLWEEITNEIQEIQKVWKTIGFTNLNQNEKIYNRFRAACDIFFEKKREYYKEYKEEKHRNLQLKTELCEKAESLMESTDWENVTNMLINLQKEWKNTGPVSRKSSDKIWKRFREACDTYFNRKQQYISGLKGQQDDNLEKKKALIEKVLQFQPGSDQKENLSNLNEMQNEWDSIGFVPIKHKEKIITEFSDAMNIQFDRIVMDEDEKSLLKFKNQMEALKQSNTNEEKLEFQKNSLIKKLRKTESDMAVLENNIGFFNKSANAESLIKNFQHQIEAHKKNIELLNKKLSIIDKMFE